MVEIGEEESVVLRGTSHHAEDAKCLALETPELTIDNDFAKKMCSTQFRA